jgi:hypothetical protein
MTDVVRDPVLFCATTIPMPSGLLDEIELPFGLPTVVLPVDCDDVIKALSELLSMLGFMAPLVKLAGCFLKLIDAVTAVPEAITSLDPTVVTDALAELADCGIFLSELTMAVPTSVLAFCKMILGVIDGVIKVLVCISYVYGALTTAVSEAEKMRNSPDEYLRDQAGCMDEQVNTLRQQLSDKLKNLEGLVVLINVLLAVVGPLIGVSDQLPSVSAVSGDDDPTAALDAVVQVLTTVRTPFAICAGRPDLADLVL